MKSSLIALGSNLLVNLNICKAIRWITTFGNGNMLSSLRFSMRQVWRECYYTNDFFL